MTSKLPINATSEANAERIARDLFATQAPEGITLTALSLDEVEPVLRPFSRVAAAETGATATYVFTVEYSR